MLTCLGISIGFHRLFTHRAYETYRPIRYGLAVLGSMAVQGPVIRWVSDRKHHNFADREGDPHSPHAGFDPGVRGKVAGLWHAHVGRLFRNVGRAERTKYAKDLLADRGMVFVSRWFGLWVALSLALPFAAGWLWGGTPGAALQALFWGGLIRIFLLHHITWSVNSVCHFVGSRRFRVKDESRNVWWLSWISLGESWHHNHHAFPSSGVPRPQALGARPRRPRDPPAAPARPRLEGRRSRTSCSSAVSSSPPTEPPTPADSPLCLGDVMSSPLYRGLMTRRSSKDSAFDFELPLLGGSETRPLADFAEERPVALVFGSYT